MTPLWTRDSHPQPPGSPHCGPRCRRPLAALPTERPALPVSPRLPWAQGAAEAQTPPPGSTARASPGGRLGPGWGTSLLWKHLERASISSWCGGTRAWPSHPSRVFPLPQEHHGKLSDVTQVGDQPGSGAQFGPRWRVCPAPPAGSIGLGSPMQPISLQAQRPRPLPHRWPITRDSIQPRPPLLP